MSLLTETGTGRGSHIGNVTVRAWIVLMVVATGCVNTTMITVLQIYAELQDKTVHVQIEPVLSNVIFAVVGWYFAKTTSQSTSSGSNPS